MNKEVFWKIIDKARDNANGDEEKLTFHFMEELSKLTSNDLLHFQFIYEVYELAVIKEPSHLIWSALIVINRGYCTDTNLFAGWLICNGKNAVLNAFANADSLSDLNAVKDKCKFDGLQYLAAKIYKKTTFTKIKQYNKLLSEFWCKPSSVKEIKEIEIEIINKGAKRDRNWSLDDLKNILPRLYAKHIEKNPLG